MLHLFLEFSVAQKIYLDVDHFPFQELPPVRNSLNKKKKKKKIAAKLEDNNSEDTKASRISGYDYRAWDKFDVVKFSGSELRMWTLDF